MRRTLLNLVRLFPPQQRSTRMAHLVLARECYHVASTQLTYYPFLNSMQVDIEKNTFSF